MVLEQVARALGLGAIWLSATGEPSAASSTVAAMIGDWPSLPDWWEAVRGGELRSDGVIRADVRSPRGRRHVFEIIDAGLDEAKRNLVLVRSITARIEAEAEAERTREALAAARDAALGASRAKSAFLANMSHELRTPLNAILGYGEMLYEEADADGNAANAADLKKIIVAGRHLLQLISDVLDLSKIEAGRVEVRLAEVDLADLADEVLAGFHGSAAARGNRLTVQVSPGFTAVRTDGQKLRQIVNNLVSNGVKFTEHGTVDVGIAPEGDRMRITVRDTGIGMTEEQQQRLFTEFYQADSSTTRKYGGTGLGLAISRRYVQMLGGEIELQSKSGAGSTFTVLLPVREHTPLPVVERPRIGATIEQALGQGSRTVLVIDDDPYLQEMMVRYLSKEGITVVVAGDGAEGVAMARRIRPSVITLDVMMPGANGWAVLQRIKAEPELASIPVIMVTMLDDYGAGFALGAADYLTKPLARDRLVATIRRHLPGRVGPILLVEDDEAIRDLGARALIREGWGVELARNGREALAWLADNVPAMILLDLLMPDVDGFEVLAWLRQSPMHADVPIIVVTAMEIDEAHRQRLVGNVQSVVQKGTRTREGVVSEVAELIRGLVLRAESDETSN